MPIDEFAGKVVLVTGAGRGAGRQVSVAFGSLGGFVAANDINPLSVDETVDLVIRAGGQASAFVFDIAKRMPVEGMVAQVLEQYGRIDCLVNHTSVAPDASLLDMDEWDFHRSLDVNLAGPFFTMQQVGRVMRQQGGGSMVNLISMKGTGDFSSGRSAYAASRVGLIGLTRAAAGELSAYHIRVNSICYGAGDPVLEPLSEWDRTAYNRWNRSLPDGSSSNLPVLVKLVLFLCSEAGASLNGQVIPAHLLES